MSIPCSSLAVANRFIDLAQSEGLTDLTPMKLLKLVYFAHGWHLGIMGKPLVDDRVEAWKFGPVMTRLYCEIKQYGTRHISRKLEDFGESSPSDIPMLVPVEFLVKNSEDERALDIINLVWEAYKGITAMQLSNLTHLPGAPWSQTVEAEKKKYKGLLPTNTVIPTDCIRAYFKSLVDKNSKN